MMTSNLDGTTCILIYRGDAERLSCDFEEASFGGINDFFFLVEREYHASFAAWAQAHGLGDAWKSRTFPNMLRLQL